MFRATRVVDNNWRERKGAIKRKLASVRRNKRAWEGRLCEELKGRKGCRDIIGRGVFEIKKIRGVGACKRRKGFRGKKRKEGEKEEEEGNNSKGKVIPERRGESFLKCMRLQQNGFTRIGIRFTNGSEEKEILYCEKTSSLYRCKLMWKVIASVSKSNCRWKLTLFQYARAN